jgi:type I restriction enzyme M protein
MHGSGIQEVALAAQEVGMSTRISQQQLESYLWGAATLLRGTIDAGDYKQFIFPLLFYKRLCDVFDEETKIALKESGGDNAFAEYPENHRFQIPKEAHWLEVRQTSNNVGKALQSAMRAIEKANPDKLFGIFGDAQWTNKDRLSDAMLRDLIEHFSCLELTVANLPEDELGQGYEYLIKKFADDSGHTAAEFYTNRTVVHLMTEMLAPQSGESIYDPTCGSGGMLLSCITHLRRQEKEWRNVRLYGQERNLMTSSIARMNCFLHGIEDFLIVRGDTLSDPKLVEGDRLMRFDVVLANPPYSIKQWDRDAFASDPWGRNLYGTPPQGRADYAFWQHILLSLNPKTGRCAILFPHGVLFRQEEAEMRRKLIEADVIECVLGLGPNLFYNSPMEACIVICRMNKPKARRGRILFINAIDEVTRERAQSFLTDDHVQHIVNAYVDFKDEPGFARVVTIKEVEAKDFNLSIPLFVEPNPTNGKGTAQKSVLLSDALNDWLKSSDAVTPALETILPSMMLPENRKGLQGSDRSKLLIDRTGWTPVRFGEVVENVNETESDPMAAGIERYIGLEHLEPGSLHVRTWGDVAEGTTFSRRCRPGQVLFGKRRAYQRKVAVAEFDAVVSGDIYVFAPKNGLLLPGLLPFLCLSERFFQYALETSAGSLSPRTNWTSLSKFDFGLPPLDQQGRIVDILWSMDKQITGTDLASKDSHKLLDAKLEHFLYNSEHWPAVETGTLLAEPPRNGYSPPANESGFGLPTLSISAIRGGEVIPEGSIKYAEVDPAEVQQFKLRKQDILVVRGNGNRLLCGRAGIVKSFPVDCFYPDLLIRLRFREDALIPEFAVMQWNESKTHLRLLKKAKSTNGISKINGQDVKTHKLLVPPLGKQLQFLESLEPVMALSRAFHRSATDAKALQIALINRLVGGTL